MKEELEKLDDELHKILRLEIDKKQKHKKLDTLANKYCNLVFESNQDSSMKRSCMIRLAVVCECKGISLKEAEQEAIEIFNNYKKAADYTKEKIRQWGDKK